MRRSFISYFDADFSIENTDVRKTISELTLQIAVYGETVTRRAREQFSLIIPWLQSFFVRDWHL